MTDKKEIKKLVLGIIAAPVFYIILFLALLVAGTAFVKMTEQEDLGDEYVLSYDTNDIWTIAWGVKPLARISTPGHTTNGSFWHCA